MRIYSMTATFGKLEHQTLTLKPGLNVISAPNEWGKSTWCAFLINMLYGIDTRQRSSGSLLADKERYAPWSGSPMSGRIELNWQGRDITIERSAKGRVPFGSFRAYETETGLEIPELDGTNCGRLLLGVERSVFTRAGFIRLSDMPVTQDDALRRRLNDLVTTGDESGAADQLGAQLKDLKNKCRYNNSGLLPQAETEREQLRRQLDQVLDLKTRSETLQQQQTRLNQYIADLENHETTLRYNASREDAIRVERTQAAVEAAQGQVDELKARLQTLPDPSQAKTALDAGNRLKEDLETLQTEKRMLPPEPEMPVVPGYYAGLTPQQAVAVARAHFGENQTLEETMKKTKGLLTGLLVGAAVLALIAVVLLVFKILVGGLTAGVVALVLVALSVVMAIRGNAAKSRQQELFAAHPGLAPSRWVDDAEDYVALNQKYMYVRDEYNRRREDLHRREQLLAKQIDLFAGESNLQQRLNQWNQALSCQQELDAALSRLQTQQEHLQSLRAMVRTVPAPAFPDRLQLPLEQTVEQLAQTRQELQQVRSQLHQCQGRSEALGDEAVLRSRLDTLLRRISRLEDTYYALELAQDALHKATTALQRRFAPRIAQRARDLFGNLTGDEENRLILAEDFSLSVSAGGEDTLHNAAWRSDGTVDQLYLALRLAVAEELTPEAPLVLDDALVRFDDIRLEKAMELLKHSAQEKQIILFTCQKRELDHI